MGLGVDDHNDKEQRSTPKLSLSRLPCKPKHTIQMLTPPLHPSASIPFRWEEAPGKPRFSAAATSSPKPKSKAVRCLELDLPQGLLHDDDDDDDDDGEVTLTPSPMMVLDGSYAARSLSFACTFSFRKGLGSGSGREGGGLRAEKRGGCGSFGSRRWRSWRSSKFRVEEDEEKVGRGSFDISQSLGDFFKSEKNVKLRGIRRVRSFFASTSINYNLLNFCANLKHSIQRRRRR